MQFQRCLQLFRNIYEIDEKKTYWVIFSCRMSSFFSTLSTPLGLAPSPEEAFPILTPICCCCCCCCCWCIILCCKSCVCWWRSHWMWVCTWLSLQRSDDPSLALSSLELWTWFTWAVPWVFWWLCIWWWDCAACCCWWSNCCCCDWICCCICAWAACKWLTLAWRWFPSRLSPGSETGIWKKFL